MNPDFPPGYIEIRHERFTGVTVRDLASVLSNAVGILGISSGLHQARIYYDDGVEAVAAHVSGTATHAFGSTFYFPFALPMTSKDNGGTVRSIKAVGEDATSDYTVYFVVNTNTN